MIEVGEIQRSYDDRVDLLMAGGRILRNIPVVQQITAPELIVGTRAVVLMTPQVVVLGLVKHNATPGRISVSYTSTGDIVVDGTLDVGLPGVIKCMATAFESGTGFWLEYNNGTPRFFVGDSDANYISWDGTTFNIVGMLKTSGGETIGGPHGLESPQPNLLWNGDFSAIHANHLNQPIGWVFPSQSQFINNVAGGS